MAQIHNTPEISSVLTMAMIVAEAEALGIDPARIVKRSGSTGGVRIVVDGSAILAKVNPNRGRWLVRIGHDKGRAQRQATTETARAAVRTALSLLTEA